MKITLLQLSKTDDPNIQNLISTYQSRLKHYIPFQIITIPPLKNAKNLTPLQFRQKEAELILNHIQNREYVVLLDETGKELTSKDFAAFISKTMNQSIRELTFLIGGAFGVSDQIKKSVKMQLSLSRMTFPHQLIRPIFLEQLYRAFTIIRNEPYHND